MKVHIKFTALSNVKYKHVILHGVCYIEEKIESLIFYYDAIHIKPKEIFKYEIKELLIK